MTVELMDVVQPCQMAVQPFAVVAMTERRKEIIGDRERILLTQGPRIVHIADLQVMQRKSIDGFIVERISGTTEIFPSVVPGAIGNIGFAIIPRVKPGSRSGSQFQSLPLGWIEGIKTADRTYVQRPGRLITRRKGRSIIHEAMIGLHMEQAVRVGIGLC